MSPASVWSSQSGSSSDLCPVGLRGIVPSLNTPFDAEGSVDLSGIRRLVDHCVDSGCAGMLCLAVASEAPSMTADEIRAVVQTTVAHAAGRIAVIVSVTDETQTARLERAHHAAAIGAHGILCQPPPGGATERLEMLAQIAEAGPDFLMIQDLDWTGPGLPLEEVVALTEAVPRFASLKIEVAPAGPKYSQVLAATNGRLHVCGGWAVMQMVDALRRGVHAFMPTCMEQLYVEIHRRFQAGDEAGARRLHGRILPTLAFSNQHIWTSISFFKRLRQAEGVFASGVCRPPVPPFDAAQKHESDLHVAHVMALIDEVAG